LVELELAAVEPRLQRAKHLALRDRARRYDSRAHPTLRETLDRRGRGVLVRVKVADAVLEADVGDLVESRREPERPELGLPRPREHEPEPARLLRVAADDHERRRVGHEAE